MNQEIAHVAEPNEKRRADDRWRDEVTARMDTFDSRLAENTQKTEEGLTLAKEIKANTDEIVKLFASAKGFVRFGGMLGSLAAWIGKVAVMSAIIWVIFKYGVSEAWRDITGVRPK